MRKNPADLLSLALLAGAGAVAYHMFKRPSYSQDEGSLVDDPTIPSSDEDVEDGVTIATESPLKNRPAPYTERLAQGTRVRFVPGGR